MHRRLWLLAVAAVAVLLLAASATARTTSSGSVHAASLKAAPFAESWAQTPRTVAGRKAKDTVVIADEQDPSGFNVYQATQSSAWAGYMVTPVIRGAYMITDQGEYVLDLAKSVKATKTSLTITLRQGPCSNGRSFSPVRSGSCLLCHRNLQQSAERS